MEEVAQDRKEPGVEVCARLEAMDIGQGAKQSVLDEIVRAVDLPGKRDGKGAQAWDRRQKRIPQVRLQVTSRSPAFPFQFRQKILEAVGTGCCTRSSYIARSWSPMRFWLTLSSLGIGRKLLAQVIFGDHPGELVALFRRHLSSPCSPLPSG